MITVILKENLSQKDIEVLIKYGSMNQTVKRLVNLISAADSKVTCNHEQKEILVPASAIYYIESIDKKTFVYCEKEVYRSNLRLYQLITELASAGFVQISKSCILNIECLESIKTLANSRMEATLINGERVTVSRKYIPVIKEKLQGGVL